jgi:hypothetical protein
MTEPGDGGIPRDDGDDGVGDDDVDLLTCYGDPRLAVPKQVLCYTLQALMNKAANKPGAPPKPGSDPTSVATYFYLAATHTEYKVGAEFLAMFKSGPFSTEVSRSILTGTLAKAKVGSKQERAQARTRAGVRAPGSVPLYDVLAHLYAACPWIIGHRFVDELSFGTLTRWSMELDIHSGCPNLGEAFVIDDWGRPAADDDDDDEAAPSTTGGNPAEDASYAIVNADGGAPAVAGPAHARRIRRPQLGLRVPWQGGGRRAARGGARHAGAR